MDAFKKKQMERVGCGGLKCPCCNELARNHSYKKKTKNPMLNRLARRKLKRENRKEITLQLEVAKP